MKTIETKFEIGQIVYGIELSTPKGMYSVFCNKVAEILIRSEGVYYKMIIGSSIYAEDKLGDTVHDAEAIAVAVLTKRRISAGAKSDDDDDDDDDDDIKWDGIIPKKKATT